MGEPVRIEDVARRMIQQSGEAIRIEYTGLRPGEKLHEVLFGRGEHDSRPNHPLISQVTVPPAVVRRGAGGVLGRRPPDDVAGHVGRRRRLGNGRFAPRAGRGGCGRRR